VSFFHKVIFKVDENELGTVLIKAMHKPEGEIAFQLCSRSIKEGLK